MAPSRRKGAGKAVAAAAARRQWKVGDLVLAKVKGFPAWPATVSEPEKWGYSSDVKKVLVYFFGTQQIAFCNPVDVEAFTEEKKLSLLGKRHGKGADFTRAVNEIIESYENMKKQGEFTADTTEEATLTDKRNAQMPLNEARPKDGAPNVVPVLALETPGSAGVDVDICYPTESTADATKVALVDKEVDSNVHTSCFEVPEVPELTTYSSRRKLDGIHSRNCVTRSRAKSSRSSRSSRVASDRIHRVRLPSSIYSKSSGHAYTLRDGSARRNKRIRKSPDGSDQYDMNSLASLSNGSFEENDSDSLTADSDILMLKDGNTESSREPTLMNRSSAECNGGQRLEFHTSAFIIKKKRKPSRKRPPSSDNTEILVKLDKDIVGEAAICRGDHHPPNNVHETMTAKVSMENGDEHLPLVKRARLRMGRLCPMEETATQTQEILSEVPISSSEQAHTRLSHDQDDSTEQKCSVIRSDQNSSPKEQLSAVKPKVWFVGSNNLRTSSVDDEAALPPSKRLHRALKAMSANAAEDTRHGDSPSPRDHPKISTEHEVGDELEEEKAKDSCNDTFHDSNLGLLCRLNVLEAEKHGMSLLESEVCTNPICNKYSPSSESRKDISEAVVNDENVNAALASDQGVDSVIVTHTPDSSSCDLGKEQTCFDCNSDRTVAVTPTNDNCGTGSPEWTKTVEKLDPEISLTSLDHAQTEEIAVIPVQVSSDKEAHNQEGKYEENGKLCQLSSDTRIPVGEKHEAMIETGRTQRDSLAASSSSPVAHQYSSLSHSISVSDDGLGWKTASVTQSSSSSPSGGLYSVARGSPANISTCNTSALRNNNIPDSNCNSTCDATRHNDKPKLATKGSNKCEANAALASFESFLGKLTRTKESIGRATRIAIDCAKFGVAAKALEIVARNLEAESSLHKRVDLFFLIDSITQCSRGLKGSVGDIYPSAIQTMLPRLLLAAVPPGCSSQENRRQCLKVLRVWQERSIFPEFVVRRHIRELDSRYGSSSSGAVSHRLLRNERAFDDPIREMEGMVDEYGSNSSIQLPGFHMPPILGVVDDGIDSDGESFEAVTPEHNCGNLNEKETTVPASKKHKHILEEVDGELEMEDVAPCFEAETNSTCNISGLGALATSHCQLERHSALPYAQSLSKDVQASSSLPRMPPPPPLQSLPHFHAPAVPGSFSNNHDLRTYTVAENITSTLQEPTQLQSVSSGMNPTIAHAAHVNTPKNGEFQSQMPAQTPEAKPSSLSIQPVCHPPVQAVDGIQPSNSNFNKGFHLRPPHPAPSNQFSYVKADKPSEPRTEIPPPSYLNKSHSVQNRVNRNFCRDRDRMKVVSNDGRGSWRSSAPSSGPGYHDRGRMPYAPPYAGPSHDIAFPNHRWGSSARPMHHRGFLPHRQQAEGPIPVGTKGSNFWRPR